MLSAFLCAFFWLNIFEELERRGLNPLESSIICQKGLHDMVSAAASPEMLQRKLVSDWSWENLERVAARSQKRLYPEDWVFHITRPHAEDDWTFGVTYTECAICKLFHKLGAQRFLRYICLNDYPMYGAMGVAQKRTETLAEHGAYCDFMMKAGGKDPGIITTPELLPEWRWNTCLTYFKITGDFEPDAVSELLQLKPTRQWRVGDIRRNGSRYEFAHWEYGSSSEYDVIVENQMMVTIRDLLTKMAELRTLKEQYGVSLTLVIVPTVHTGEVTPCLAPSSEVMKFCCESGTEIDIDLYVRDKKDMGQIL